MTTHKNQVGQAGAGINGGEFARKIHSEAADEILSPFTRAREEQHRAHIATMTAAAEAIPAVVTAYDEDIAEVHFEYDVSYGLVPRNFAEETGSLFPVDYSSELYAKIFDAAGSLTDYRWLTEESPFRYDEHRDRFILTVPGTDPVGRHIRMIGGDHWSIVGDALEIIRERDTIADDAFLQLTETDVDELGEDYIDRAIAGILTDIDPDYDDHPDIDSSRINEIHNHLITISNAAHYGSMDLWLEAAYDRKEVSDEKFLALTADDVRNLYGANVEPAIDSIEERVKLKTGAGDNSDD